MATRALTAGLLTAVVLLATGACSGSNEETSSPEPTTVAFPEVGLQIDVPGALADLTYAMGESEEGQPAVYFSTEQMATVGGPTCAAGATAAVSPYPLGQIVVSEETPRHVREEARENPEENLGAFVKRVGDSYLYYVAPPDEPCVSGVADAPDLQQQLTASLKEALPTLSETE